MWLWRKQSENMWWGGGDRNKRNWLQARFQWKFRWPPLTCQHLQHNKYNNIHCHCHFKTWHPVSTTKAEVENHWHCETDKHIVCTHNTHTHMLEKQRKAGEWEESAVWPVKERKLCQKGEVWNRRAKKKGWGVEKESKKKIHSERQQRENMWVNQ